MFQKVKNFIEDIILVIKNYFTSSRFVVKGKCKMCGKCCENIIFSDEKGYIKDIEIYNRAKKEGLSCYNNFYPNGIIKDETEDKNGTILFKCKFLKNHKCSIYFFRPLFCRTYPIVNNKFILNGGTMLDDCGFYFEADKKFSEYLN